MITYNAACRCTHLYWDEHFLRVCVSGVVGHHPAGNDSRIFKDGFFLTVPGQFLRNVLLYVLRPPRRYATVQNEIVHIHRARKIPEDRTSACFASFVNGVNRFAALFARLGDLTRASNVIFLESVAKGDVNYLAVLKLRECLVLLYSNRY